jgi:alkylated DNA repair dioxygenase AlkB
MFIEHPPKFGNTSQSDLLAKHERLGTTSQSDLLAKHERLGNTKYIRSFLSVNDADKYLSDMYENISLEKKDHEGRLTALYGDTIKYKYALNVGVPLLWTKELLEVKLMVEKLTNHIYNVCLINYYQNGKDKFNFHSDKEEIGNNIPIAVISLGAQRKFYFRSQTDSNDKFSIILEHGSLLLIDSIAHENYLHALPPDNSIKKPRMSLTFRFSRNIE